MSTGEHRTYLYVRDWLARKLRDRQALFLASFLAARKGIRELRQSED